MADRLPSIRGKRWLAGSRIAMNLSCRGKLAAKDRLHAWKKELGGMPLRSGS